MSALDTQVSGDHYRRFSIQPTEYIHANGLDFISGNIVKYASRWPHKDQGVADLKKVIHYAQILLELEFGVVDSGFNSRNPSRAENLALNELARAEARAKYEWQ